MILEPGCVFIADDFKHHNEHTKVISTLSLEDIFYIKLNAVFCAGYSIYRIVQVEPVQGANLLDKIYRDAMHPWISGPISIFDTSTGLHIYRIDIVKDADAGDNMGADDAENLTSEEGQIEDDSANGKTLDGLKKQLKERDMYSQYFSYIIENTNPAKPYVYMERDNAKQNYGK